MRGCSAAGARARGLRACCGAALALGLWVALAAQAAPPRQSLTATVVAVNDGDTVVIEAAGDPPAVLRVRIEGIDAPESCQPWGREAGEALRQRVLGREVRVELRGQDVYRRSLGRLSIDGEDLGGWMLSQGHAWTYGRRADTTGYGLLQRQARDARLGLFSLPDPMRPEVFRRWNGPCRQARP